MSQTDEEDIVLQAARTTAEGRLFRLLIGALILAYLAMPLSAAIQSGTSAASRPSPAIARWRPGAFRACA